MNENDVIEVLIKPDWQVHPKTYNSPDGFYIYDCTLIDGKGIEVNKRGKVSIKGKITQKLQTGTEYKAELQLDKIDPTFGASYWIKNIYQDIPETPEKQRDYFKALLTNKQVEEIFKVYPNEDIIDLIKNNNFDWKKVHGFGEVVYERVRTKVLENLEYKEMITHLGKYGINYNTIQKIMSEFGSAQLAIQKIKENPYVLIRVGGIGFKTADAIALNMARYDITVDLKSGRITREKAELLYEDAMRTSFRIITGVKHALGEQQNEGHTYTKFNKLVQLSVELLQIEEFCIEDVIKQDPFEMYPQLHVDGDKVMLLYTHEAEKGIANYIKFKLEHCTKLNFDVDDFVERMERKYKDDFPDGLSEQQKSLFEMVKNFDIGMLVGFAGSGKSAMQKLLKELLTQLGLTVKWLTPTGKAAKILTEYLVDQKGMTIHRAIGYGQKKDDNELIAIHEDFIVIDEWSMVDVHLCASLFKKIKNPNTRLLFVGDGFQIPSVGCGNLLHDMQESNQVPITVLDIVFRQSEGGILDIATKIRNGQQFIDDDFIGVKEYGSNLRIHSVSEKYMIDGYKFYYQKYLDEGYKPEDIMLLTMKKKGDLGTIKINKEIQKIVNPFSEIEIEFGEDNVLRKNDYIINTRNTYRIEDVNGDETDIVNGDTGFVIDIITDTGKGVLDGNKNGIIIQFDHDQIRLPLVDKIQLLHSWCLTMHKSQGSSAPVVIIITDPNDTHFCNANLIYTALTRARYDAVIVCEADELNRSLSKKANLRRRTMLNKYLVA
ncbi:hypothetical protein EBB07_29430 [Paenibacillaceae bacterium]|nr:hypothetical protein EBB07_29430 [Paenibacillaceae bacterium]